MVVLSLLAALASANATLHPESPGVAVRPSPLLGVPLCVWNDSSLFNTLKNGMQERGDKVFRFPNGSYSDIYHWNGTGKYDVDSIWVADKSTYTPGWAGGSLHRGMTNGNDYSLIADGDTSTYWWSNPEHPSAAGWFLMDLADAKSVDSVALWLGTNRPDSVQLLAWTGSNSAYPAPHQQMDGSGWATVARLKAGAFVGFKLPSAVDARYVAVRPLGTIAKGWQVREFKVLNAGVAVSNHAKKAASQSPIYAISTHPSTRNYNYSFNWDFEAFMTWVKAYPNSEPLVCVNYGTGTPQEAAAWVNYANKVKGYGIKRWQIGNEQSGQWEEAGCVTARQYAERFVQYAKAMKAVDPTIEIEGPVLAGTEFVTQASGDYDGRSWMGGFLYYVDSAEKATGMRLVDGIDFHNYPYWFTGKPTAAAMMKACDANGAQYDSLIALMARTISSPASREILMTEFNTSTVTSSMEMEASAGTAAGLQFAHFIQRFGNRGLTNLWELYTGIVKGADGTYGSLSALVKPTQGEWSSLGYPPNATFWSTRTIAKQWLDPNGNDTILPVDPIAGVRLFAVRNSGRVSVLALNMTGDSASVSLDAALFPKGGDVLSWGTGEYLWTGTDEDARAIPDNGPSSKAFAAWNGSFKVPPYGMAVARGTGRVQQAPRTAHWLVSSKSFANTDTLVVSGWTTSEGFQLTGGSWNVGDVKGVLSATDGTWDGPSESWTAKIPASLLVSGKSVLKVSVFDNIKGIAADSTAIEVTGSLRPAYLIADFEDKTITTSWGAGWYPWTADGGKVSAKLEAHDAGYCMRDTIVLTQPDSLNYTNFNTTFTGPDNIHKQDSLYGIVGVVFDLRTKHSSTAGTFSVSANLSSVKNYDNYSVALPNTEGAWVKDTVLFSSMKQAGWGAKVPFVLDSLSGMSFASNGAGTIEISLDNIYFLGTGGKATGISSHKSIRIGQLSMSGRNLSVNALGSWSVRLVAADGRTSQRWTGSGATTLSLPRTVGPQWAILEGQGLRNVIAVPPVAP